MMTFTNQITYGSGAIAYGYDPEYYGQNGKYSLSIQFDRDIKQWSLTVSKLTQMSSDSWDKVYIPFRIITITAKQAGAILSANKLHIWAKNGFSKTIDRRPMAMVN